jgi:hypothetical protein
MRSDLVDYLAEHFDRNQLGNTDWDIGEHIVDLIEQWAAPYNAVDVWGWHRLRVGWHMKAGAATRTWQSTAEYQTPMSSESWMAREGRIDLPAWEA